MRSGFLILLIPLIFSGTSLHSQPAGFDSEIRICYFNLDFNRGDLLLKTRFGTDDASWIRLSSLRGFLDVLVHQTKAGSDRFFSQSGAWLKKLDRSAQTADAGAGMAEIRIYRAVLASQFSEYKSAAVELIAASRALAKYGTELRPHDRDKLSGVLGVIFRQVPPQYVRYLGLAGIRPAGFSGFNGLERCYSASVPGSADRLEAYLLMVTALKEFGKDPADAWKFVLGEGQPMLDCPLVRYQSAMAARKAGESALAAGLLVPADAGDTPFAFPLWCYQAGRTKLYLNSQDAGIYLERFIREPAGDNYRHSAMLMAAWFYIMQGDENKAASYLADIRKLGNPMTPYDRQAMNEAGTGVLPDRGLLRARLLFDGGNYRECLRECRILEGEDHKADARLAEIVYRRARCEQRLGQDGEALASFIRVTGLAGQVESYMLPNSALQAGHLYKKAGQFDMARKYYQMCLEMNHYGYREGIAREAEVSLKELDR